jgi:2-dehydro-3-deoxyphosphogluconate aldolase/(4S)-4-hydroxy-2-oxoglutarate aldolase
MNSVLQRLGSFGVVPVVVIPDARHASPLAAALQAGGLGCVEVTLRTPAGLDSISAITRAHPSMLTGAGTVLSIDQAKAAADRGAKFIVSPGLNRKVVEYCLGVGLPVTPGVVTPTEIEAALDLGLEVVKFFPAEPSGGLSYLKAVSAPYGGIRFIPTGGIDEKNLSGYLRFKPVLACGGSWMVKKELIEAGGFEQIERLTAGAVEAVRASRAQG